MSVPFSFSATPAPAAGGSGAAASPAAAAAAAPFSFAGFGAPAAAGGAGAGTSSGFAFGATGTAGFGGGFPAFSAASMPAFGAAPAAASADKTSDAAAAAADKKAAAPAAAAFGFGASNNVGFGSGFAAAAAAPPAAAAPAATAPATGAPTLTRAPASAGPLSLFAAAALPAAALPAPVAASSASAFSAGPAAKSKGVSFAADVSAPSSVGSRAVSADVHPSRDFFGLNLAGHPIFPALAGIGAFTAPPQAKTIPTAASVSHDGSSATKDKIPMVQATPPMENRLAASSSGTLFFLVPPASAAAAASASSDSTALIPAASSSRQSRLFYMDLKPLKTPHLRPRAEQLAAAAHTPAFRELICHPTPLPAHSHSLQLNSQGTYAAVHSTNTVYLVFLATNKLEKALMASASASPADQGVKVKCASVGSWFHQNNTSLQILQVAFHPLSDIHLYILTNDSVLRVYNIKDNLDLPVQEISLESVAQAQIAAPPATAPSSRRNSITGAGASRSFAALAPAKPMVVGFCFGSQPASRASFSTAPSSRSRSRRPQNNAWDLFSVYFLFASGSITMLCPSLPPKISVDRKLVMSLRAQEQQRFDDLSEAMAAGSVPRRDDGDSTEEDLELEQLQARLIWIGETFGIFASPSDGADGSDAAGIVVSRDTAHVSNVPDAWIQPAQPCGANTMVPAAGGSASSSTLQLPTFFAPPGAPSSYSVTSASSVPAAQSYPHPASHLFSFRHAWPVPPGRFFRAFVDGRLDLLLSLQGVQPLFATPRLRELFADVDAAAALSSVVRSSGAIDEVCQLLAPGGRLESYSVNTFLLPADVSKLDGVEVPVLATPPILVGPPRDGPFSRSLSVQSPPNMSRPQSGAMLMSPPSFGHSPSLNRGSSQFGSIGGSSVSGGVIPASALGTPLHPFLPQFRPLFDLHDGSGLFFVLPRAVVHASYGEQLEEIASLLQRGERNNAADDGELFTALSNSFEQMKCEQKGMTSLPPFSARYVVGAQLIDDPLLGRYLLQLTAGGSGSGRSAGPHIDVIELPRSSHRTPSIRAIMDITSADAAAAAAASSGAAPPSGRPHLKVNSSSVDPKDPSAATLEAELAKLKYTPFSTEIAAYLSRLSNFVRPPGLTPPTVKGQSLLNSPESFGEFLQIRKQYVSTIQDLTLLESLIRARLDLLGVWSASQKSLWHALEKDLVAARATQAKIEETVKVQVEMQTHLGQSAVELQSDLTVHLADLSPAEETFHRQLFQLRDSTLPRFHRKLEELQRKSAIMAAKQREMQQAQKALKQRGMAPDNAHKTWTQEQMHALQPVLANQSSAIQSLVAQLAELKNNMITLRSHSALQRRGGGGGDAQPMLRSPQPQQQQQQARLMPAHVEHDQPL